MKSKSRLLINIITLCLCISAIAIGVYSAKNASLNVTGTIGFEAHDVKFKVSGVVNCANGSSGSATLTDTNIAEKSFDATGTTISSFAYDVGTLRFNDAIENGNIVTVSLTFTNLAKFTMGVSFSAMPELVNGEIAIQGTSLTVTNNGSNVSVGKSVKVLVNESKTLVITIKMNQNTLYDSDDLTGNLKMNLSLNKYTAPAYSEGLLYELNTDGTGAKVTGIGTCTDETIIVPSKVTINGTEYAVTEVGVGAFGDSQAYVNISSEETVTEEIWNSKYKEVMGGWCWQTADYSEVILPNTITTINQYAFVFSNLVSIIIPNSVTSIVDSGEIGIFTYCTKLVSVEFPNSISTLDTATFAYCTSLATITIPTSISEIPGMAFFGCTNLTSIEIPNNIKSIGTMAFTKSGLSSITIPSSVNSLGDNVFYDCSNLTSVTIAEKSGWQYSTDDGSTWTAMPESNLSDPTAVATALTTAPMVEYIWKREA